MSPDLRSRQASDGLRDPEVTCPFCGVLQIPYYVAGPFVHDSPRYGNHPIAERIGMCRRCGEALLVQHSTLLDQQVMEIYPQTYPARPQLEGVPKKVLADYHEAIACAHYKAHRAAVAMARRALQQVALVVGAPRQQKLVSQIDWLAENGHITEQLRKAAHLVRALGNEGAHPDEDMLDELDGNDADDALRFVEAALDYMYVMPHRVAEQEKRIATRKGPGRNQPAGKEPPAQM